MATKKCTFEKVITIETPPEAIWDFIVNESVDKDSVVEIKDATNHIVDIQFGKICVRKGYLIAWPDYETKTIMVGYSRCTGTDEFNMYDAVNKAMQCAKDAYENCGYVFEHYRPIKTELQVFLSRVHKYYKQLMYPGWKLIWKDYSFADRNLG